MPDFETITLQTPRGTKTAWVRQARGQKLSAWALAAVARGAALDAAPAPAQPDYLSAAQFDALADLLSLRPGPAQDAARLVLVGGLRMADAARQVALPYQCAWRAVQRAKRGLELARAVCEAP